ncbi:DoxX family protein [Spirosoma areae]
MNYRLLNQVSWLLGSQLSVVFFIAGFAKLAGANMHQSNQFEQWGYPDEMRYIVGLLEVGLGIGLLWPHFRLVALYEIFFWAVGAVLTQAQAGQWEQTGVPLLLAGISAVLLLIDRHRVNQFMESDRLHKHSFARR